MDSTFTVTPMSQRIQLKPGETYSGTITIVNPVDATADFKYRVYVAPYGVTNESYDADFVTSTDRTQMAKWITIDEPEGEIKPNGTKKINFTIKVPESAPGGGQYASLMVGSNDESDASEGIAVQNVFEMASLIYGEVDGDIIHSGEILENNVPGFSASTPVTLSALIKNDGNLHEDATFVISATNFFTGEVILPTEENEGRFTEVIMPETTRYASREVENLPAIGVVHISQTIYYNGASSVEEKDVLICPIWFMVLVAVTLGVIIAAIVRIVMKHRKTKKVA